MKNKIDGLLLLLIIGVLLSSTLTYIGSRYVEKRIQGRIVSDALSIVKHSLDNLAEEIVNMVGERDLVEALYTDEILRWKVEDRLSLFITPEIKFVFVVYRDEKNKFRFLADGSKEDKGTPGEKLDVVREDKWIEAIEKGKEVVIIQEGLDTIGATYLKPLIQGNVPKALLVADISIQKVREITGVLGIIKNTTMSVFISAVGFLAFAVYQYVRKRSIERSIYIDKLTGLYTREFVYRENNRINFTDYHVALIDIDNFRRVNATYGEEIGDLVLKEIATLLKIIFNGFIIVRYSGEEFLVLIPKSGFSNDREVLNLLNKVREGIKRKAIPINGDNIRVSVSIGVNLSTQKQRSLEEAIKGADRALYRAKRNGKDRVEVYDERLEESRQRLSVAEVREAIETGRVICLYQPIINLRTGKVFYYEALSRIVDTNGRLVSPSRFLEDIKDTFIYTRFVKEIIRINAELLKTKEDIHVSINLLPTDLEDDAIMSALKSIPEKVRKRILLEITEVEGIYSFERIKKSINELRRLGYRAGIDDFGAGYSNLINITQLKIDFLKIDGSLIKDIVKNEVSEILTATVADFCKKVGIRVIAEYVENPQIIEKLMSLGIEYGQGFYLGKPGEIQSSAKIES